MLRNGWIWVHLKLHAQFCDWCRKAFMILLRKFFIITLRLIQGNIIQGNVIYVHFKHCRLCICVSVCTILYIFKARSWSLPVLLISWITSYFREIWRSMYLDCGHREWGNSSAYSLLERKALSWLKDYFIFFKSWFLDSASVVTDWEMNFNMLQNQYVVACMIFRYCSRWLGECLT